MGNFVLRVNVGNDSVFQKDYIRREISYGCEYKGCQSICPYYKHRDGIECFYSEYGISCKHPKKFVHDAEKMKKYVMERMEKYKKLKIIECVPDTHALLYRGECGEYQYKIKNYCNGTDAEVGKEWYDCPAWTGCKSVYERNSSECPFFTWNTDINGWECGNNRLEYVGLKIICDSLEEAIKIYSTVEEDEKFNEYILEPDFLEEDYSDEYELVMKQRKAAGF